MTNTSHITSRLSALLNHAIPCEIPSHLFGDYPISLRDSLISCDSDANTNSLEPNDTNTNISSLEKCFLFLYSNELYRNGTKISQSKEVYWPMQNDRSYLSIKICFR